MEYSDIIVLLAALFGVAWLWPRLLLVRGYLSMSLRRIQLASAEADEVPKALQEILRSRDEELAALGFAFFRYHRFRTMSGALVEPSYGAIYRHASEPIQATVSLSFTPEVATPVFIAFDSAAPDGTSLTTYLGRRLDPFLPPPPGHVFGDERDLAGVLMLHRERLATAGEGAYLEPELEATLQRWRNKFEAYLSQLRAAKLTTATDAEDIDRIPLQSAIQGAHGSITALRRLQRSPGPTTTPAVAAPTERDWQLRALADVEAFRWQAHPAPPPRDSQPALRVLFAATLIGSWIAAALFWSPTFATLLMLVLAVHEAGHALAMLRYGYRDVSVFFLPLIGALATARPAPVSATQQAVVLLAGPVPGLLLATALLVLLPTGMTREMQSLIMTLVILNAFNLLPFGPLDGGGVLRLIAGERPAVNVAVQMFGVVGLLMVAWYLESPFVALIGLYWGYVSWHQKSVQEFHAELKRRTRDIDDAERAVRVAAELTTEPPHRTWPYAVRQTFYRQAALTAQSPAVTRRERAAIALWFLAAWALCFVAVWLWLGGG